MGRANFEETVMAHLDAAYNLARWLTRDERDAEDVVQEACLRAFRFHATFHGGNARAWLLAIVRNTYYTWHAKKRAQGEQVEYSDELAAAEPDGSDSGVDKLLEQDDARELVHRALARLPPEFREVLVLRELEDLSYREIAEIAQVPLGTVMSRLARARKHMLHAVKKISEET